MASLETVAGFGGLVLGSAIGLLALLVAVDTAVVGVLALRTAAGAPPLTLRVLEKPVVVLALPEVLSASFFEVPPLFPFGAGSFGARGSVGS
jgi:hypothetical protein